MEGKNGKIDWCIMELDMDSRSPRSKSMPSSIAGKAMIYGDVTGHGAKTGRGKIAVENGHEEGRHLKAQPGKDIWLYGGASLITYFINAGLVDEFRLSIHPVVLGEGKPLFNAIKQRVNVKLASTRTFSSGVVQLIYHRDDNE